LLQRAQRRLQRARVLDTFDDGAVRAGYGRQAPHPDIDPDPRIR
jgi:hypothetical protein